MTQDIVKAEVAKLLDLKQKLAAATGGDTSATKDAAAAGNKGGKGKSKGKKK